MATVIKEGDNNQAREIVFWEHFKQNHLNSVPDFTEINPKDEQFLYGWNRVRRRYQRGEIDIDEMRNEGTRLFNEYGAVDKKLLRVIKIINDRTERPSPE